MTPGEERFPALARVAAASGLAAVLERVISDRDAHSVLTVRDCADSELFHRVLGDITPAAEWSPDGRFLAFIAKSEDGLPQVQLADFATRPASCRQLTDLKNGVNPGHLSWAPDGASLLVTAPTAAPGPPEAPYRVTRRIWRYEGLGLIEDNLNDVCSVTVEGEVRWLGVSRGGVVSQPRWAPDGQSVSYLVSFEDPGCDSPCPSLRVWSAADNSSRQVLDANWGWIESTLWAPDSSMLLVAGAALSDAYSPYAVQKSVWAVRDGSTRDLTDWLPGGAGSRMQGDTGIWWPGACDTMKLLGDGRTLLFTAESAGRTYVSQVDIISGDHEDRLAYSEMASYALMDVFQPGDDEIQLTLLETAIDVKPRIIRVQSEGKPVVVRPGHRDGTGPIRRYQVRSADGATVDAWVLLPVAGAPPYPTILKIHGGPYGSLGEVYAGDATELASRGFAVVFHNFRGSYGYGTKSAARISENWGTNGEPDHHAVLDHVISLGIADPARLGVMGHSHGAFATCWLVGRSRRFSAGVSEDPVTNFFDKGLMTDVGPWLCAKEFNLKLSDPPEGFLEMSPITYAKNCTTPLLLIQGERDVRCPPAQSEQMYTALWETGCKVEMMRLPASDHMTSLFGSHGYRAARIAAVTEWFEKYLSTAEGSLQER